MERLVATLPVEPTPEAEEFLARCVERAERMDHSALLDPGRFLDSGNVSHALCDAEMEIYREGVSEGCRASVGLRLASRFRTAGYPEDVAEKMVSAFASRCSPPLLEHEPGLLCGVRTARTETDTSSAVATGTEMPPHTKPVRRGVRTETGRECATYSAVVNGHSKGMGR